MNKLMIAASAALLASAGFGEITSANIVGYAKKDARADLNWYAPQFQSIGKNTIDIQSINLDDNGEGNVGYGDVMQIVGPGGNPEGGYAYWASFMAPEGVEVDGDFYWANDDMTPAKVAFDQGDGIAIDNANAYEMKIANAGEVIKGEVSFAARADLNWTGNPFSAPISIQAITLDDAGEGNVGYGDVMQIVGPGGNPEGGYAYWASFMAPEGVVVESDFYWANDDMSPSTQVFQSGDGFAIDNGNGYTFDIKIACPY